MNRRNLVIVRAGDQSLHETWLGPLGTDRSWDLVVSYFGDDPDMHRRNDVIRIDHPGTKFQGLYALLMSDQVNWRAYDRIWLPDDDLACTTSMIERLFTQFECHQLHLAQPSLSHDSYLSHAITIHNPKLLLRRVNFVEVMAPLFSRALLERTLHTFAESESGWGLDFVWPKFVDSAERDAAILDAVQIRHTRPIGGPAYTRMKAEGRSPQAELDGLLRKYGITDLAQICWSAIDIHGHELRLNDLEQSLPLLSVVMDGMRPWLTPKGIDQTIEGYLRTSHVLRTAGARTADQFPRNA